MNDRENFDMTQGQPKNEGDHTLGPEPVYPDDIDECFLDDNQQGIIPGTEPHVLPAPPSFPPANVMIQQRTQPYRQTKKKKHGFLKGIGLLVAALLISVSSIGGFAVLVNRGVVKLSPPQEQVTPTSDLNVEATDIVANTPAPLTQTSIVGMLTAQQVAQKVIPSVVCIENFSLNSMQPSGEGSGIIMTADGYIMTNAHVVAGASSLKVVLHDGASYEAKLIGADSTTDLALVKIEAEGLQPATFGNSESISVADQVMAVGNPGGMEFSSSVTSGIVSAVNREIVNESGYSMGCIQTDAAINPGNSGGALVNMKGEVVGINSSKIVANGYEGLGFAITINGAQPILSDLKEFGYVKNRAVLGVSYQFIDAMIARFNRVPQGIYILDINNPGVSDTGIQAGDIITQVEEIDLDSITVLTSVIAKKSPGDEIKVTIYRPSTRSTFSAVITLAEDRGIGS